MPNIPSHNQMLPGIYGPTVVELVKTENGFAIGWSPISSWGEPFVEGSVKHIARQAFLLFSKMSTYLSANLVSHRLGIYGAFLISFNPEANCILSRGICVAPDINIEQFLIEMNEELDKLKVLLPFS